MVLAAFGLQELMKKKRESAYDGWLQELQTIYDQTLRPYDERVNVFNPTLALTWHTPSGFTIPAILMMSLSPELAGKFPLEPTKQDKEEIFGFDYPSSVPSMFFPSEDTGSTRPMDLFYAMSQGLGAIGDLVYVRPNPSILSRDPGDAGLGWWGKGGLYAGEQVTWDMSNGMGIIIDIDHAAREITVLFGMGFGAPPAFKRYVIDSKVQLNSAGRLDPSGEAQLTSNDEAAPVRLINGTLLPMQYDYGPYEGPVPQGMAYEILNGFDVQNGQLVEKTRWMPTPPAVLDLVNCVRSGGETTTSTTVDQAGESSGISTGTKVVGGIAALGLGALLLKKLLG